MGEVVEEMKGEFAVQFKMGKQGQHERSMGKRNGSYNIKHNRKLIIPSVTVNVDGLKFSIKERLSDPEKKQNVPIHCEMHRRQRNELC